MILMHFVCFKRSFSKAYHMFCFVSFHVRFARVFPISLLFDAHCVCDFEIKDSVSSPCELVLVASCTELRMRRVGSKVKVRFLFCAGARDIGERNETNFEVRATVGRKSNSGGRCVRTEFLSFGDSCESPLCVYFVALFDGRSCCSSCDAWFEHRRSTVGCMIEQSTFC